jgi:hypothetical protein
MKMIRTSLNSLLIVTHDEQDAVAHGDGLWEMVSR